MRGVKLQLSAGAALVAFAANSLLCRLALLQKDPIDPASFTTIRIVSGALTLLAISYVRSRRATLHGSWWSAVALFTYAILFSLAYVRLTTATGALILFGAVQITMIGAALRGGDRLRLIQWLGLSLALAGLVILCLPGLRAPDPLSALAMSTAGLAWGVYSLRGRGSGDPIGDTCGNFVRAVPLALVATLVLISSASVTPRGALLAILSGAIASGVGYALWYSVVPRIRATAASILQLLVPVLAAAGGIVFLGELLSVRLIVAAAATLGGIALTLKKQ